MSKLFKPRNYTIPVDFKGDELLYFYKRPRGLLGDKGPEFCVCLYNLSSGEFKEFAEFPDKLTFVKFFKQGFAYVKENKQVCYFDLRTKTNELLYVHQASVAAMAISENIILTIDK